MATRLFVGSLPWAVDDAQLEDLFKDFGTITSAKVIIDRDTNRSRGYGFVEFEDDDAAKAAIDKLNNSEVSGRTIVVNEARPQEARPPRRDFGGDRGNDGGRRY
ncbi:RNA-binding protein [Candidatus Saccharibacteria bacterium]|nr:MAG: RNA-binding protein [Candidatus Saccharibacteria bacterium]